MPMPKRPTTKIPRKPKRVQYRPRHKRLDHLGQEDTQHGFEERLEVSGTQSLTSEPMYCSVWGINQAESSEMEINNGNCRFAIDKLEDSVRDRSRSSRKTTPTTSANTGQHDKIDLSRASQEFMEAMPQHGTSQLQCFKASQPNHTLQQYLPNSIPVSNYHYPTMTENVDVSQLPVTFYYGEDDVALPYRSDAQSSYQREVYQMVMEDAVMMQSRQTGTSEAPGMRGITTQFPDPQNESLGREYPVYGNQPQYPFLWEDVNVPMAHNFLSDVQNFVVTDDIPPNSLHYIASPEIQTYPVSQQYDRPLYRYFQGP